MAFLAPIAALFTAGAAIHGVVQQRKAAGRAERSQREALQKQEAIQKKQELAAKSEKEQLQKEQSEEMRRSHTRGRRSLLAGEETGVDLLGGRGDGL